MRTSGKRRESVKRRRLVLDDTDRLILRMLQENARVSNVEIARQAGMVPSGILERLRKLKSHRIIVAYEARLDARALGLGLTAFVFVRARERQRRTRTAAELVKIPEVQEVHNVAGEDCYLVKVRASSPEHLGRILREKMATIPAVEATRTSIVLETLKETSAIPLGRIVDERAAGD
jgi:Lrp/AsnC family transcriptional regulator, leucine-responsive regulatory protein